MRRVICAGLLLSLIQVANPCSAADELKEKFERLVLKAKDDFVFTRLKAIEQLGQMGAPAKDAIPVLQTALRDPHKDARSAAAEALAKIGPAALPVFIDELQRDNPKARVLAARSLAAVGPDAQPAVPVLIANLNNADADVRAMSAYALGHIGAGAWKSAPTLITRLTDKESEVQKQANDALGRMGREAIPTLGAALKSDHTTIRMQVVDILARYGPDAKIVVPELIATLDKDGSSEVRRLAAVALAAIGPEANDAVDSLSAAAKKAAMPVRLAALTALGKIGYEGGIPALIDSLTVRDPQVRMHALEALARIGAPAVPQLIDVLPEIDLTTVVYVYMALGQIGAEAKAAVPIMQKSLRHENVMVRSTAARALGQIGSPAAAALPDLTNMLQDRVFSVRASAALAIAQLQPGNQKVLQLLSNDFLKQMSQLQYGNSPFARPRTPQEFKHMLRVERFVDFFVYRNSFRFGDGISKESNEIVKQLGHEAVPAIVRGLNEMAMLSRKDNQEFFMPMVAPNGTREAGGRKVFFV